MVNVATSSSGAALTASSRRARFVIVGALGFVVQAAVLWLLVRFAHAGLPQATGLAVVSAILHNYVWHERWTWGDRSLPDATARRQRVSKFVGLTACISIGGNVVLTTAVVSWWHWPLVAANLLAVTILTLANWFVADSVVFAGPHPTSQDGPCARHERRQSIAVSTWLRAPGFRLRTGSSPTLDPGAGRLNAHADRPCAAPRTTAVWAAGLAFMTVSPSLGAELTPATLAVWDRYERAIEQRTAQDLRTRMPAGDVLWPMDRQLVLAGEVFVERVDVSEEPPGGSIHHWRAAVLVRGVTLDHVLEELQSLDASRHIQEDVLQWRMIAQQGDRSRIFLRLRRQEIVTVVYNTEHDVTYTRHGASSASSGSASVRIAELQDTDTAAERERPVGHDRGFLWRMNSYWRYQQVSGGVVIQVESLTLSRHVPFVVAPLASPLINRVARESLVRTLQAVRARMLRRPVA